MNSRWLKLKKLHCLVGCEILLAFQVIVQTFDYEIGLRLDFFSLVSHWLQSSVLLWCLFLPLQWILTSSFVSSVIQLLLTRISACMKMAFYLNA